MIITSLDNQVSVLSGEVVYTSRGRHILDNIKSLNVEIDSYKKYKKFGANICEGVLYPSFHINACFDFEIRMTPEQMRSFATILNRVADKIDSEVI